MSLATATASHQAGTIGPARPTIADLHTAVQRVYPGDGDRVWATLLATAGLTGQETTPQALHRLIDTATAGDPVLSLVACAQIIRVRSFEYLSAIHDIVVSALQNPPRPLPVREPARR